VDLHTAPLPEQQQAKRVVELGVGEQDGLHRHLPLAARTAGGMQSGAGLDLGVDIG
jgi:hypothetical protein